MKRNPLAPFAEDPVQEVAVGRKRTCGACYRMMS